MSITRRHWKWIILELCKSQSFTRGNSGKQGRKPADLNKTSANISWACSPGAHFVCGPSVDPPEATATWWSGPQSGAGNVPPQYFFHLSQGSIYSLNYEQTSIKTTICVLTISEWQLSLQEELGQVSFPTQYWQIKHSMQSSMYWST